jgi:chromosome partitioning protein
MSGRPAAGFQKWIDDINAKVRDAFIPVLRKEGMLLPDAKYHDSGIEQDYCLASISDFNSLIAKSQEHQVPVFLLSDKQIRLTGPLLQRTKKSKDMFKGIFSKLADMVVTLTNDARNS